MMDGNRPIDRLQRALAGAGPLSLQVTVFSHDLQLLLDVLEQAELATYPNDDARDDQKDKFDLCTAVGPLYGEQDHSWGRWTRACAVEDPPREYRECRRCDIREYRELEEANDNRP